MKVSVLSLRWIPSRVGEGQEVEVLVDGVNLIHLAREWEAGHTPEPELAGEYAGVQHWEADSMTEWLDPADESINVLECTCGVWGCWPLQTRVVREGEYVLWSGFVQPHRRDSWSYVGFGPFVFDAAQYEAQVKALLADTPA